MQQLLVLAMANYLIYAGLTHIWHCFVPRFHAARCYQHQLSNTSCSTNPACGLLIVERFCGLWHNKMNYNKEAVKRVRPTKYQKARKFPKCSESSRRIAYSLVYCPSIFGQLAGVALQSLNGRKLSTRVHRLLLPKNVHAQLNVSVLLLCI